jgi:hypothetical protein
VDRLGLGSQTEIPLGRLVPSVLLGRVNPFPLPVGQQLPLDRSHQSLPPLDQSSQSDRSAQGSPPHLQVLPGRGRPRALEALVGREPDNTLGLVNCVLTECVLPARSEECADL